MVKLNFRGASRDKGKDVAVESGGQGVLGERKFFPRTGQNKESTPATESVAVRRRERLSADIDAQAFEKLKIHSVIHRRPMYDIIQSLIHEHCGASH